MIPQRIQRKRTKGWRMPPNSRCVTRPGVFGNPFTGPGAVEAFRKWLEESHCEIKIGDGNVGMAFIPDSGYRQRLLDRLPELRGKNLACYCPIGSPCHADVLLELANK